MKRFWVAKIGPNGELVPSDSHYLVVNVNEPYVEQVFDLIKAHEQAKGTWGCSDTFEKFLAELEEV